MNIAIEIKDLQKHYGERKAVDGISFQVESGELFGFLGVNGAGKTTTINMLCTLLKPTKGSASVCGIDLSKDPEQIRRRIGVVCQNNCLDNLLTVQENLFIRGSLYERNRAKVRDSLSYVSELLELAPVLKRPFGKLSGGQKRKCEIARALMNRPQILFLDEPTTGLDPATRKNVWSSIGLLRKEMGTTIFLTTHYMEEAARASHIAIIDEGRLKEFGTPFSLKEKYAADLLKLKPKDRGELTRMLDTLLLPYREKEEMILINLKESMEALAILEKLKDRIDGFEVVQGSMDDVFLQITGKELKESAQGA